MMKLYHYPLDPFGRQIRLYLNEKKIEHELFVKFPWDAPEDDELFLPCDLPILIDKSIFKGWYSIIEYLEKQSPSLFGFNDKEKAETRRIITLFNDFFFADVTRNIIFEKVIKRYTENASPDSSAIRKGNRYISKYFDYISWLIDRRNWLASEYFSFADIVAGSHISSLDYIGAIEWEKYPEVKSWYVRIKSRPSFRDILNDRISNITPPAYYKDLDF